MRSASARPWPPAPRSTAPTGPATTSSTSPTPPSAPEACSTTSSPPSAGGPASTPPPSSPKPRDALAAELSERGRTPVLLIDEAHLFGHDALEAIRLLTNHELDTGAPFATILLGQPTLAAKMRLGVLAALEQRITVRHQMIGMTADETAGYIRHHLALAGRSDPIFTDDAIALIHTSSRGKPRSVNNLAIAALIAARAKDKTLVDEASARSAITETTDHITASP